MEEDPHAGDTEKLTGHKKTYRRRVGDWRIIYDIDQDNFSVIIKGIRRRTSTTYRH
jgi:mRNA-degrading endonuclease RelE of RelBE toxin-antitoxin system